MAADADAHDRDLPVAAGGQARLPYVCRELRPRKPSDCHKEDEAKHSTNKSDATECERYRALHSTISERWQMPTVRGLAALCNS